MRSSTNTSSAEYDDFNGGLDKARRARDRYRHWRGRNGDDDDSDDAANGVDNTTPGFDVVKPRPSRRLRETAAETGAPPTTSTASEVATVAARGGAAAEAGAAGETATVGAEAAGALAAPEVAIPSVALTATAHHLRKRHHPEAGSSPNETTPTPAQTDSTPAGESAGDTMNRSPVDDTSDADLSLPTVSPRPTSGAGRHAAGVPSGLADISASGDDDPTTGQLGLTEWLERFARETPRLIAE